MAQKTMAVCPECKAKVRKDNLKSHIERVHRKVEEAPREKPKRTPGRAKPKKAIRAWPAIAVGLILGLSAIGVLAYTQMTSSPPNNGLPPSINKIAIVNTNYGTFKIRLYTDEAPRTTGNFINLAESGYYNGLTFCRVKKDFVIQGGDRFGDCSGGSGTTVDWEDSGLKNIRYSVAMARSDSPDSATSQFFINLAHNVHLDNPPYPYVVFGTVIEGQSVIDTIANVPVEWHPVLEENSLPQSPVVMNSVTITTQ